MSLPLPQQRPTTAAAPPPSSMDGDEEEDTGYEMLTGVELYHHLTSTNHAKQTEIEQKISSYGALSQTLTDLLAKPKHAILAPLCGGLAYVEAELVHTNDVLVLLGDSWFAERSVKQAQAITDRRVAFLKNESAVLRHEAAQLEAKKEMFFLKILFYPTFYRIIFIINKIIFCVIF